jgi:Domain of unknown function (DUF932)
MKAGRTLQELAVEIERQSAGKRDFVADTRELTMLTTSDGSELHVAGSGEFGLRPLAHEQVADHLDIPRKYYSRLRGEHPVLLDHNVNALLRHQPKRRMVRTLDGQVRAFLSDRYRRLDHDELAQAILPVLGEIPEVQFPSTEITETRLYIKAVAPRVSGEVSKDDVVQAGVVISNSEVGMGALLVQPLVYRLVCTNGLIAGTATRRYHVGRQIDSADALEVYRDATLRADDRAFWLKVADVVRAAVEETRFRSIVERMRLSAQTPAMVDPSRGVEELGRRFHLGEQEQVSVLRHLTLGGDLTQYGALNAVTRAAQDVADYDRATELETIGGAILAMGGREWRTVAEAAR